MQTLEFVPTKERDRKGPLKIPIIDKKEDGGVVIAQGKIESGIPRIGDKIFISPSGHPAQIGSILDYKKEPV